MTENPVDLRSLIVLKADNQRSCGLTVAFALNLVFKSCFTQLVIILIRNPAVLIIVVRLCVSTVRRIRYAVAVGISVPPHFNRIVVLLLQFSSRIIETILKGVVFIMSPFFKNSYTNRSSYLLYNKDKHCGFVHFFYSSDCYGGDSNRSRLSQKVN